MGKPRILQLFGMTRSVLVWHLSQKDVAVLKNIKYAIACSSHIQARCVAIVQMGKWVESSESVMCSVCGRIRSLIFLTP